jgi:superfamily I DNA/RNA helicase
MDALRADLELGGGTLAVIASDSVLGRFYPRLEREFGRDAGRGAAGLARRIAVLTPQEAKGLEFDSVIVVEPLTIIQEIPRGAAALYVAMTRPTQRLRIVTTRALPPGIE